MKHLKVAALLLVVAGAAGAYFKYRRVPPIIVPDLLITVAGDKVDTAAKWREVRRPEILELFRTHVYGRAPAATRLAIEEVTEAPALDGLARRKQWRMRYGKAADQYVDVLMYVPAKADGPVPAFVGLNFLGNQSVHTDPAIRMAHSWIGNKKEVGIVANKAVEASRGTRAERWSVEKVVARGYGVVTAYYGDIDPDTHDDFQNGVHGAVDPPLEGKRADDAWGSIAAWAWGLSRILDTLEDEPAIDAKKVAVIGHSRLGKTALWAGANDDRFALVISNNSGCGGAAFSRRRVGETVKVINTTFPHWFCSRFRNYNEREDQLPVDQHMLIASIAPRPAYVASAAADGWADPDGEFYSTRGASPAYELLGTDGLPDKDFPAVSEPVHGQLGYHVRPGGHGLQWEDWQQYLAFADKHFND